MPPNQRSDVAVRACLAAAVASPFVYFGTQLVAAPFYPGYSFVTQAASMLGSDLSTRPWVFNVGAMLTGVTLLIGAIGVGTALVRAQVHPILAWPPALSIAINGYIALNAGRFPLPDPRHGGHPILMVPVLLFPVLMLAAIWKLPGARAMRIYLIVTAVLIGVMVPIMAGVTPIDKGAYEGVLQRITTLLMFPPIGVGAWWLMRRMADDGVRAPVQSAA